MTQEAKKEETFAAIAADIRKRAEVAESHGDERVTSGHAFGLLLLSLADRMEAAAARLEADALLAGAFCERKRIDGALAPLLSIDLSKTSPLPWKSKAYNHPIADAGDYCGQCEVVDADGNWVLAGDGDGPNERIVEIDDFDHDANCVAAAACVNAVAALQKEFGKAEAKP